MEVIATCKLDHLSGFLQIPDRHRFDRTAGAGALMALLRSGAGKARRLKACSMRARKQLIPHMPSVVGVFTSPTGAVIRDIIHRITDRFPLHVIVWPCALQGRNDGRRSVGGGRRLQRAARRRADSASDCDRGTRRRSLEDLWGFNDVIRRAGGGGLRHSGDLGRRPRDRLPLIDHVADIRRADAHGSAEMAGAGVKGGSGGDARQPVGPAESLHLALDRAQARPGWRACARALPSADQLLAMPRRHFDEVGSRLDRGV